MHIKRVTRFTVFNLHNTPSYLFYCADYKYRIRKFLVGKIALAALIIGPLTRPETVGSWVIILGILATLAFALLGYLFDGMEVKS